MRLETAGGGVKRAGRGWGSPPNELNDSLGAGRGRGAGVWVKSHPTSLWTHWVGLGLETPRWGVKRVGRGRGSPPNELNDLLGGGRGPGGVGGG